MGDLSDFSGKSVLVTGSSRGIGAALVSAFAARGARCVINYVADGQGRNRSDAERVAGSVPQALVIQCDVGEPAQVKSMIEEIGQQFGGLDILVNNAGLLRDRTLQKMSADEWASVLRVNLTGAFNCIQQASGILRSGGRVVNLASLSGQVGFFGQANYAASKAGLIALTKVAARELARREITVNAVAPGFLNAGMGQGMPEDVAKGFLAQIPLGRWGTFDDVVPAVLFLASPLAGYITGQVLHINGGFYM